MKRLAETAIDAVAARSQLRHFSMLCARTPILKERRDVLPFFAANADICMIFANYISGIKTADRMAVEFKIYGDFVADLVVGDFGAGRYLLVEFEDGGPASIFSPASKTAPQWSSRFDGAFSQIVDWLWKLEDMRMTNDFAHVFGHRHVTFSGLIVIGKDVKFDAQEQNRLKWRQDKVMVDSKGRDHLRRLRDRRGPLAELQSSRLIPHSDQSTRGGL